jgi:hypothetical protein
MDHPIGHRSVFEAIPTRWAGVYVLHLPRVYPPNRGQNTVAGERLPNAPDSARRDPLICPHDAR